MTVIPLAGWVWMGAGVAVMAVLAVWAWWRK